MLNSDFTVMEGVVIESRIIATLAKSSVADPDLLLSFSDLVILILHFVEKL